jgi:hypothetical protein
MSWGERSCKKPCRCPERCEPITCNVNCPEYVWDGATRPDSISKAEKFDRFNSRKRPFWETLK